MNGKRGAALVEFALMAFVLYLLVAGGVELGRSIFVSQVLQDAARVAARELSVTPLPAGYTFDCSDPGPNTCVLNDETVLMNIWNPNLLVIDTSTCYNTDDKLNTYLNSLPPVNRALRPAFISETLNPGQPNERRLLRYPGALQSSGTPMQNCPDTYQDWGKTSNPSDLTVAVYQLNNDNTVTQIPVLAEVRSNPNDLTCAVYGPFSFIDPGPVPVGSPCGSDTPAGSRGIAAVAVNYPFQSAALSGFRSGGFDADGAPNPNMGNYIVSDDPAGTPVGTYTGPTGLGNQYAFATTVRPYRSMLLGQAIFRREVSQ